MSLAPQAPMVGVGLLAWTACVGRALAMKPLCIAVLHRAVILPPRAQCRHNVTHQNEPFSSLRAASLSVGALNMDDATFSMSSNVIIFMVNFPPPPLPTCLPHTLKKFRCGECGVLAP